MSHTLGNLSTRVLGHLARAFEHLLLSPGSIFSIFTLLSAFSIAALFLAVRRRRAGRDVKLTRLLRALFPKAIVSSNSGQADIAMLAMNTLVFGALITVAVASAPAISTFVNHLLVSSFGERRPVPIPHAAA